MSEKGFTATFTSHSGKTHRRYDISGWKLQMIRILFVVFIVVTLSSVIIVAFGLFRAGETGRLREEVFGLQDSLMTRRNMEMRLEIIEEELERIREFRQRIENVAGLLPPEADSLEQ